MAVTGGALSLVGLVCATVEEFRAMEERLSGAVSGRPSGNVSVLECSLGPLRVVLACAGTGKAGAAAATQLLVERYGIRAVVNFGTAGALREDIRVGDVVVPEVVYQGDVGVIHGGGFGHTGASVRSGDDLVCVRKYMADRDLLEAARLASGSDRTAGQCAVLFEPVVTCDQVVLCAEARLMLNRRFDAAAVEMEGGAVAHVATLHHIPFLCVRSVSDAVDMDIVGLECLFRYDDETGEECRSRRMEFASGSPEAVERINVLRSGIRTAAGNSAAFTAEVLDALVSSFG